MGLSFETEYRCDVRVRIPFRWAALRARCSVRCMVLHVVVLIRLSNGAAYVSLGLTKVL